MGTSKKYKVRDLLPSSNGKTADEIECSFDYGVVSSSSSSTTPPSPTDLAGSGTEGLPVPDDTASQSQPSSSDSRYIKIRDRNGNPFTSFTGYTKVRVGNIDWNCSGGSTGCDVNLTKGDRVSLIASETVEFPGTDKKYFTDKWNCNGKLYDSNDKTNNSLTFNITNSLICYAVYETRSSGSSSAGSSGTSSSGNFDMCRAGCQSDGNNCCQFSGNWYCTTEVCN